MSPCAAPANTGQLPTSAMKHKTRLTRPCGGTLERRRFLRGPPPSFTRIWVFEESNTLFSKPMCARASTPRAHKGHGRRGAASARNREGYRTRCQGSVRATQLLRLASRPSEVGSLFEALKDCLDKHSRHVGKPPRESIRTDRVRVATSDARTPAEPL